MARSRVASGKAGSRVTGKSRGKKPKGRQSGTRKRGGGRVMHAAPPWAIAGDDGSRRDDSQEQHDGADWADAQIGPQQHGIEAKVAIIAKAGMTGTLERVGGALADLNYSLGGRGTLEDVVKKANIPAGAPNGPRRLAEAQVRHVRSAGSAAIMAAGVAIEWAIALTMIHQVWVGGAEFYFRHMAFDELRSIINNKAFTVLPDSKHRFIACSINRSLSRYSDRQVMMRVRPGSLRSKWRITRYILWEMRNHDVDMEWIASPKPLRWADEVEVRLPDGTVVDLKGIYVTARWDWLSDKEMRWLMSKKSLLGGIEWA